MFSFIPSDLDGSLFNQDHELSPYTKSVLQEQSINFPYGKVIYQNFLAPFLMANIHAIFQEFIIKNIHLQT